MRGTGNILANRVVVDMEDEIAQLDPDEAPFTALTMRIAKETAGSYKFEWMEDSMTPRWDALNMAGNAAAGATKIIVDNGAYFTVGDMVQIPRTKEVIMVLAMNPDGDNVNEMTVRRAVGETVAAQIDDSDPMQIIGNANAEGSLSRTIHLTNPTPQYNFTQIYKTSFGVTETMKKVKLHGPADLDYQRRKKGVDHRIDIERSFLFGERSEDTSNYDHPLRTTRGLLKFITKYKDCGGDGLTEAEFEDFAELAFDKGRDTKLLLASKNLLTNISSWSKSKLHTEIGDHTYGISITTYVTPHGVFKIIPMKLLTGTIYGKYGIAVDLENIKYVSLRGTKLETNIQANDADQEKDQYITEAGLKVKLPDTHCVIKNW